MPDARLLQLGQRDENINLQTKHSNLTQIVERGIYVTTNLQENKFYIALSIPIDLFTATFEAGDNVAFWMSANGNACITAYDKGKKLDFKNGRAVTNVPIYQLKNDNDDCDFTINIGKKFLIKNGAAASGVITFQMPKKSYKVINMNKANKSAIKNLTGQMLKVYDAVPIEKAWPIADIVSELHRTGHNIEHNIALGCARTLVERGLVNESPKFSFIRKNEETEILPKPEPTEKQSGKRPHLEIVPPTMPATDKPRGPMELLADLAAKARAFADELDNAALEIEQEFQNSEAKSEQLKQLKSLLKGITD